MAKKLSHSQKRKAKLKKRAERSRDDESFVYSGNAYKTAKYAPIFLATERGVMEAHLLLGRVLTDDDVEEAIRDLVAQLRENLPILPPSEEAFSLPDDPVEAVIANIRRNWGYLTERGQEPGREGFIGVLRTLLGSIKLWRHPEKGSMGYLGYLENFLAESGVVIQVERRRPVHNEAAEDQKALKSEPDAD